MRVYQVNKTCMRSHTQVLNIMLTERLDPFALFTLMVYDAALLERRYLRQLAQLTTPGTLVFYEENLLLLAASKKAASTILSFLDCAIKSSTDAVGVFVHRVQKYSISTAIALKIPS